MLSHVLKLLVWCIVKFLLCNLASHPEQLNVQWLRFKVLTGFEYHPNGSALAQVSGMWCVNFHCFFLKTVKKLAGNAAFTATWATNIGNEFGQVLISVLTASEGNGLQTDDGWSRRPIHESWCWPPSAYIHGSWLLWNRWGLKLYFQIVMPWHFMRRIASACTTEFASIICIVYGGDSRVAYSSGPRKTSNYWRKQRQANSEWMKIIPW